MLSPKNNFNSIPWWQRVDWQRPVNMGHPLNRGLVSWWLATPRGRGGHFRDLMGINDGVLVNGPFWISGRRPGGFAALEFDGVNDRVDVADHPSLQVVGKQTMVCWFRLTASPGSFDSLYTKVSSNSWNDGFGCYFLTSDTLNYFMDLYDGDLSNVTIDVSVDRDWHQHAGRFDKVNVLSWLDGVAGTTDARTADITASTNFMRVGKGEQAETTYTTPVVMDDMRYYSRDLSIAEIDELRELSQTGYQGLLNQLPVFTNSVVAAAPAAAAPPSLALTGVGA